MPIGWTSVAGTPDELQGLLTDPHGFALKVEQLVAEAGASVGHIFWEARGGPAYILTHIPKANAADILGQLNEKIGPTDLHYTSEEIELGDDR